MADIQEGIDLVRRAFDAARDSGKEDWHRMAIPVLKNRILLITGGNFREADYGAASFRDFLKRLPETFVSLDHSQSPGFAVMPFNAPEDKPKHKSAYARVRPDLWRAILDYSSGQKYVWDALASEARPATEQDGGPFLPTADEQEFQGWRTAFVTKYAAGLIGDALQRLRRWETEGLPTAFLPARLRPLWNGELKERIETRLQPWFAENRIEPPSDLLSRPFQGQSGPGSEVEDLRRFLVTCINAMNERELRSLAIPAGIAFRARAQEH